MGAYIIRRLLLIIPTLIGIMVVNFALIQFVPGGPIEQIIANMEGQGDVLVAVTGSGSETADNVGAADERYLGARGLPDDVIDALEIEMGFARIVCEPDASSQATRRIVTLNGAA